VLPTVRKLRTPFHNNEAITSRSESMVDDEIQDAIGTAPGSTGRSSSDEAGAGSFERSTAGQANAPAGPSPAKNNAAQGKRLRKRLLTGALAALLFAIAAVLGVPWVKEALNTVSTDDAYVNGHVTFVSARVPGQVFRVLVDDNSRVRKGDLLAELDREPYEVAVATKKAAVDTAKADLIAAKASVRGIEARARSQRWKLQHVMEDVDNQVKLLHSKIATLDRNKATLKLAGIELERTRKLLVTGLAASQQQYDRREAELSVAQAEVTQALDDVHQIRVSLGLPATPERGGDLGV
jgi:membrane fusion protein (multidrug efflux system)